MSEIQEAYNKDVEWLAINIPTPFTLSELGEFEEMMGVCLNDGMAIEQAREIARRWVFGSTIQ